MDKTIRRIFMLVIVTIMTVGNYTGSQALFTSFTVPSNKQGDASCLSQAGPLLTITGRQVSYSNKSLPAFTKIDASKSIFSDSDGTPIRIAGSDICWSGGWVKGGYSSDTPWAVTHPTFGIAIYDGSRRVIIERIRIEHIGDGIKIRQGENSGQAGIAEPLTIRAVWLKDIRDDCIESDWQAGVNIEDSLLDGCYAVFAATKRNDVTTDGSNNVWYIANTLAFMHDQIGVFKGVSPGHSQFFKWDETAPKIKIYNSIFRVDSATSESANQFNFHTEKIVDCSNNTLVWLGPGSFPGVVPDCFTITTDKTVWDTAVATWKFRHGYRLYPAGQPNAQRR